MKTQTPGGDIVKTGLNGIQTPLPGAMCENCSKVLLTICYNNTLIAYYCDNVDCAMGGILTRRSKIINSLCVCGHISSRHRVGEGEWTYCTEDGCPCEKFEKPPTDLATRSPEEKGA
jgi:hypothetical protein